MIREGRSVGATAPPTQAGPALSRGASVGAEPCLTRVAARCSRGARPHATDVPFPVHRYERGCQTGCETGCQTSLARGCTLIHKIPLHPFLGRGHLQYRIHACDDSADHAAGVAANAHVVLVMYESIVLVSLCDYLASTCVSICKKHCCYREGERECIQ